MIVALLKTATLIIGSGLVLLALLWIDDFIFWHDGKP